MILSSKEKGIDSYEYIEADYSIFQKNRHTESGG